MAEFRLPLNVQGKDLGDVIDTPEKSDQCAPNLIPRRYASPQSPCVISLYTLSPLLLPLPAEITPHSPSSASKLIFMVLINKITDFFLRL